MEPVEHPATFTAEQAIAILSAIEAAPRGAPPTLDARVARLEANVESILVTQRDFREELRDFRKSADERFEKVDERFERIDDRFTRIDDRFERVERKIDDRADSIRREMKQDFYVILGFLIAMLGVMAKGFHWL